MLKKLWLVLLLACLLPVMALASDSGTHGDNLTWTLDDNGLLTISGTGAMTEGASSFYPWHNYRASIQSVVIENGVTSIGLSAFESYKGLTSVTISNGVSTIGQHAFAGCTKLQSITIPGSVTSIGNSAFYSCTGLTSVTLSNEVS